MGYFFLIAKTGLYGLLQFFPTLISLFIIQYIPIDYVFRNKKPTWYAWVGILFFFSCYEIFMVASGIRSTICFSVFTLALYRHLILHERSWWLFFITPFIHLGAIIPISILLILKINKPSLYISVALVLFYLLIYPGGQMSQTLLNVIDEKGLIGVNLCKLLNYIRPFFPTSFPYLYKLGKLIALFLLTLFLYKKTHCQYIKFCLLVASIGVISIGSYFIWYRLLELVLITSPIIIIYALKYVKVHRLFIAALVAFILFTSVGIRVQLSYYKPELFTWKLKMPTSNQREGFN